MSRLLLRTILVLCVFAASAPAIGATVGGSPDFERYLGLTPSQLAVAPGEQFSIDLTLTGLGDVDAGASVLSAFDISLGIVAAAGSGIIFDGYRLGDALGDPTLGGSTDLSQGLIGDGQVNFAQTSALSSGELSALQQNTFTLVTLDFTASTLIGSESGIFIGVPEFLDPSGAQFFVEVMLDPALVTTVPVPAGLWLFLSALAMTSARFGKRNRRSRA